MSIENSLKKIDANERKPCVNEIVERKLAWTVFDDILTKLLELYNEQRHPDFNKKRDIYIFLTKGYLPGKIKDKESAVLYLKSYLETLLYNDRDLYRKFIEKIDELYPEYKNIF